MEKLKRVVPEIIRALRQAVYRLVYPFLPKNLLADALGNKNDALGKLADALGNIADAVGKRIRKHKKTKTGKETRCRMLYPGRLSLP